MYDMAVIRIAVGILALLSIALLPVRDDTHKRRAFLGFLAGLVVLFSIVQLAVHAADLVVDNEDDKIVRYDIDSVRAAEAGGRAPKNMLLVDGSSLTTLGLDPELVRASLQAQGYDALLVVFAEGGANTLERYAMIQHFSREMRRAGLRYGDNTRVMMELHSGYEGQPTRYFERNESSIRSYYYPSIDGILTAIHVDRQRDAGFHLEDADLFAAMFVHSIMWDLKIGFLPLLRRFDDMDGENPFVPNQIHVDPQLYRPYAPDSIIRRSRHADLDVEPQITFERAARVSALFGGAVKGTGYFLIPSLDNPQLRYGHRFCLELKEGACIDGGTAGIRAAMNGANFYFNKYHLSADGAQVYSKYFAEQLIAQGVVVK